MVETASIVSWEEFRPALERFRRTLEAQRKSQAGRKPMDAVVMFQRREHYEPYNLSVDVVECHLRDSLSFMRFLGQGLDNRVLNAETVWFCRVGLVQAGEVEMLFKQFYGYLVQEGFVARGRQILDAFIVPVPRN